MKFFSHLLRIVTACQLCSVALAEETASTAPNRVPSTRPEVKQALEALKYRQPRLPLPPPTEEERREAAANERPLVNNGRMRALYLPKAWTTGGFGAADPAMTLDYALKTECFWIVSRVNNCHY